MQCCRTMFDSITWQLLMLVSAVYCYQLELNYQTALAGTTLYYGDQLTVNCIARSFNASLGDLKIYTGGDCNLHFNGTFSHAEGDDPTHCQSLHNSDQVTLRHSLGITPSIDGKTFQCMLTGSIDVNSSETVTIENVKTQPQRLSQNVAPLPLTAGVAFLVTCESDNAADLFSYEIASIEAGVTLSTSGSYTPTNGNIGEHLNITCVNLAHVDYRGPSAALSRLFDVLAPESANSESTTDVYTINTKKSQVDNGVKVVKGLSISFLVIFSLALRW